MNSSTTARPTLESKIDNGLRHAFPGKTPAQLATLRATALRLGRPYWNSPNHDAPAADKEFVRTLQETIVQLLSDADAEERGRAYRHMNQVYRGLSSRHVVAAYRRTHAKKLTPTK